MAGSGSSSVGIMKYFGSTSKRPRNADKVNYSEVVVVSSSSEDEFSNCEADEVEANDDCVDRSTVSSTQIAEEMDVRTRNNSFYF